MITIIDILILCVLMIIYERWRNPPSTQETNDLQPVQPLRNDPDLHNAIRHQNKVIIEDLLRVRPGILDIVNNEGKTALNIAVENGDPSMIKLLIKWGANVNQGDNLGPLISDNNPCMIKFMVEKNITIKESHISEAIYVNNKDIYKYLARGFRRQNPKSQV